MAKIPNIKVVIPEGDPGLAVVTDRDTGEPITNVAGLRIDVDANRNPFAVVEMKVYIDVEYEGPAEIVPVVEPKGSPDDEIRIHFAEASGSNGYHQCHCDPEAIKRMFVAEIGTEKAIFLDPIVYVGPQDHE